MKLRPAGAFPKRILILSAGFGDGHNAAAFSLASAFRAGGDHAEVADIFDCAHPTLNELLRWAYRVAITHTPKIWQAIYRSSDAADFRKRRFDVFAPSTRALKHALERFEPDAVVSTYPLYAHLVERLVGAHGHLPYPFVSVVTDAQTINSIWYSSPSDHFVVIDEVSARVLREAGVPDKKINIFGFPINPAFERDPPFVPDTPLKILFVPSTNKRDVRTTLHSLINSSRLPARKITTVLGRHEKRLGKTVADAVRNAPDNVVSETVGWTDQMHAIIQGHHCVIGKAGGASVQEAMAARCPILINYVVPGQEEGNAQLAVDAGCAQLARSGEAIDEQIAELLADDRRGLRTMRAAAEKAGNPAAARQIADFIYSKINEKL